MLKLKIITIISSILLIFLFTYAFTKLPHTVNSVGGGVVINEVAWGGTESDGNDEWIELYNSTGTEVDITDWTLTATDGTPSITLSGTIPAGGYYLLERSDDNAVKDILADQIYTGALSNSGESLELRNASSELEDSVNIDGGVWPAGTSSPAQSMERIDPILPDTDDNWATNDGVITNGTDVGDLSILGTPKAQNSVFGATPSPTDEPTPTDTPTETPTESPTPTEEPTTTPTPTEEPIITLSPTEPPSPTPNPTSAVHWTLGFGSNSVTCKPSYKLVQFGFFRFPMMRIVCN